MSSVASKLDIIIVGGGIGGMAAAGYLRKAHNVTVLDRSSNPLAFSGSDYGMSMVSNAVKLLLDNHVDLEALECAEFTYTWMQKADNTLIKEQLFDTRIRFGTPSIFTRRSLLHAELARTATATVDGAPAPARLIPNAKVVEIFPNEGRVVLENGRIFEGDLVVGADGINSIVRSFVLAGNSAESLVRPSGIATYMSTIPIDVIRSDPAFSIFAGREGEGMGIWFGGAPSDLRVSFFPLDNKLAQLMGRTSDELWVNQFEREKSSIIKDVDPSHALAIFKDFHPSVTRLFSATTSGTHDVWRVRDINPLPKWSAGKVVLIGDAAHAVTPHLGQGANIAIEDAEALATLLQDVHKDDSAAVANALSTFFTLRKPRADYIQLNSRLASGVLTEEEAQRVGPFNPAEFSKIVYSYTGARDALQAMQ